MNNTVSEPTGTASNQKTFRCVINRMYKNCPKPDGWFGCFARVRNSSNANGLPAGKDIQLNGTTSLNLVAGMTLDVVATEDPKKPDTYKIVSFEVVTKTATGMISYLSSFSGVSRDIARRIVQTFGDDTLDKIENNPEELKTVVHLTDKQYEAVITSFNQQTLHNRMRKFLPELSEQKIKCILHNIACITGTSAGADDPINIIKDDPYVLCNVPGIAFPTADAIALRLGVDALSPYRVNHGLVYHMENKMSGDLYINLSDDKEITNLCNQIENLLNIRFSGLGEFGARIMAFANMDLSPIVLDNYVNTSVTPSKTETHLYLSKMFYSMTSLANLIRTKACAANYHQLAKGLIMANIQTYETDNKRRLTDEQINAVITALNNDISVITGGPGRGKTCIIDCIASLWRWLNRGACNTVVLLAPTGKAMNKLKNDTKSQFENTWTIDHMIMTAAPPNCHTLNKKFIEPLNNAHTMIIIDESSMIDIMKATRLMSLFSRCKYCFVGDVDQLPPIDPGYVLKDMIDSGVLPVARLTKPLRNGGTILSNADKINNNDIQLQYNFTDMPFYPQPNDDKNALNAIIQQYNDERQTCPDISRIALLCPTKKGEIGTVNLNLAIQNQVCPENKTANSTYDRRRGQRVYTAKGYPIPNTIYGTSSSYTRFRVGDIVMNNKNRGDIETFIYDNDDYWNGQPVRKSSGIFNGDCGKIIAYIPVNPTVTLPPDDQSEYVVVQFFDGRIATVNITDGGFESFELGYALTVHKSQGCEYDTVIYVSPKSMLNLVGIGFANKNLIYTAVTRARNRVVIMGSKESLNICIQTNAPKRNSNMKERIMGHP